MPPAVTTSSPAPSASISALLTADALLLRTQHEEAHQQRREGDGKENCHRHDAPESGLVAGHWSSLAHARRRFPGASAVERARDHGAREPGRPGRGASARLWMRQRGGPRWARRPGRGGAGRPGSTGAHVGQPQAGSSGRVVAGERPRCAAESRPADGEAVPWRPRRVGSTQSNMSTPSATASTRPTGRRRPSGSAGASAGSSASAAARAGEHLGAGLAHRQPADAVSVEADVDRALRALAPAARRRPRPARCRTAPGPRGRSACAALPAPPRPRCGRPRARTTPSATGSGGHTSSTIWMSAPSASCTATARLGREAVRGAVVGRPEGHAVVVDLRATARTPGSRPSR